MRTTDTRTCTQGDVDVDLTDEEFVQAVGRAAARRHRLDADATAALSATP